MSPSYLPLWQRFLFFSFVDPFRRHHVLIVIKKPRKIMTRAGTCGVDPARFLVSSGRSLDAVPNVFRLLRRGWLIAMEPSFFNVRYRSRFLLYRTKTGSNKRSVPCERCRTLPPGSSGRLVQLSSAYCSLFDTKLAFSQNGPVFKPVSERCFVQWLSQKGKKNCKHSLPWSVCLHIPFCL